MGIATVRSGLRGVGSDPLRDRQDAMHVPQHRLLDELAVDHDEPGVGLLEGPDDAARPLDLRRVRREHRVEGRNLLRVNRALPGKPEVAGLSRRDLHPLRVFQVQVGHVDHATSLLLREDEFPYPPTALISNAAAISARV